MQIYVCLLIGVQAIFNCSGFAIFIKVNGLVMIKNYIQNRLNLRIQLTDDFNVQSDYPNGGIQTYSQMPKAVDNNVSNK